MFWQNAYFFALALSIILILPSVNFPFMNIPAHGQSTASPISQEEYDKIKNCTTNLSKKPTPVEYLTHFNCGHISKDESGKTVRQFTLIVEENQKIPITYEGHIFEGWTFNGTIPGPTIRVTEGDLVRIRVINSNENTHAHSLYSQPTHYVKNNAFTMTGQPGGTISPGRSFTYRICCRAIWGVSLLLSCGANGRSYQQGIVWNDDNRSKRASSSNDRNGYAPQRL